MVTTLECVSSTSWTRHSIASPISITDLVPPKSTFPGPRLIGRIALNGAPNSMNHRLFVHPSMKPITRSPGRGMYLVCTGSIDIVRPFSLSFPCFNALSLPDITNTPCPASKPSESPRSSPGTTRLLPRLFPCGPAAPFFFVILSSRATGPPFITVDAGNICSISLIL